MRGLRGALGIPILLVLAGCAGSSADAPSPSQEEIVVDDTTGGLQGLVTDDSLAPIPGAQVGLLERTERTVTDAEGRFQFSSLEPGRAKLAIQALGYTSYASSVEIVAGEIAEVNVQLTLLPVI